MSFATGFSTNFLNGQDIAVSASVELADQFGIAHPAVQSLLRSTGQFGEAVYTPDNPNRLAALIASPPDRVRIQGSGEFDGGDCDVDADWWVDVGASIDSSGALSLRAEFDYDASDWDQFWCVAWHLLLGSAVGAAFGLSIVGAIGGLIALLKGVSAPGAGGLGTTSVTSCGDKCSIITITNPARTDGKFIFGIGDHSLELKDIDIVPTDVTLFAGANIGSPPFSELQIRQHNPWITRKAEFACQGTGDEYTTAGFTLYNPHSPSQAEFLGYAWPLICSIEFPEKVPGLAALSDFAEILLVGPHAPAGTPFRVHGIHQQRVEIRVRPGDQPANITSSVIVKTNTPPFSRPVRIIVDASGGLGPLEVTPNPLEFEQRNEELLDVGSLARRGSCREANAPTSRPVSVGAYFTIRNTAGGTLHICDILINDPNGVFELSGPRTFELLPFAAVNVSVYLNENAQVNQDYTATISVLSTDAQNPQVDITVAAVALDPPQGGSVGGIPVVVDNYWNQLCVDLLGQGLGGPPIDLQGWTETFTDPSPDRRDPRTIYDLAFKDVAGRLDVMIEGRGGGMVRGLAGGLSAGLSLQLTEGQVGKMSLSGIQGGRAGVLQVRSLRIYSVGRYDARSPILNMLASQAFIGLALAEELQVVNVENQQKPVLVNSERGLKLSRLAGSRKSVYGISEDGIEAFTTTWKRTGSFSVQAARDLALHPENELVFVLSDMGIAVVDFSHQRPRIAAETRLDDPGIRMLTVGSWLAVLGKRDVKIFDISRTQPKVASSMAVAGAKEMSAWLGQVALHTGEGTEMFVVDPRGKLSQVASYLGGHWADGFVAGRRLLSSKGSVFTLWRMEQRHARYKTQE
jgi:hypothetical protein